MAKEFKTIDELVYLMNSRGIDTDGETNTAIRRESYYAIINGYKGPFLDMAAMESSHVDLFLKGTAFSQIYDLFLFDRDLRNVTFSYLIRAEAILKNSVVYAFCSQFRNHDAYLERSNYVEPKDILVPKMFRGNRAELYRKNMATLMEILNRKASPQRHSRPFLKHYIETYGDIPLWVLSNDLTFGNIAHFYQLQKRSVQNEACKLVLEATEAKGRITPQELLRIFDVLVAYRNLCAHDERLYCAAEDGARYADMIRYLTRVLPSSEVEECRRNIKGLVDTYGERMGLRVKTHVIEAMGFLCF